MTTRIPSRVAILTSFDYFDRDTRNTAKGAAWLSGGKCQTAFLYREWLYPLPLIVSGALGESADDVVESPEFLEQLSALGFKIVGLRPDSALGSYEAGPHDGAAREADARSPVARAPETPAEDSDPLRQLIGSILDCYSSHRATRFVDNDSAAWDDFRELADRLAGSNVLAKHPEVGVEWSAGKPSWAAIPWVAFLDRRLTGSVRNGEICALLFAEDMSGAYLVYMLGTATTIEKHGRTKGRLLLRDLCQRLIPELDSLNDRGFSSAELKRLSSGSSLGKDYEAGIAAHKFYGRGLALPGDSEILADLGALLGVLDTRARAGGAIPEASAHQQATVESAEQPASLSREQDALPEERGLEESRPDRGSAEVMQGEEEGKPHVHTPSGDQDHEAAGSDEHITFSGECLESADVETSPPGARDSGGEESCQGVLGNEPADDAQRLLCYAADPPRLRGLYRPVLIQMLARAGGTAGVEALARPFARVWEVPDQVAINRLEAVPLAVLHDHGIADCQDGTIRLRGWPLEEGMADSVARVCDGVLHRMFKSHALKDWEKSLLRSIGVLRPRVPLPKSRKGPAQNAIPQGSILDLMLRGTWREYRTEPGCDVCDLIQDGRTMVEVGSFCAYEHVGCTDRVHWVVAPKRHAAAFISLSDEERRDLFDLLRLLQKRFVASGECEAELALATMVPCGKGAPAGHLKIHLMGPETE